VRDLLERLGAEGVSILLNSHLLGEVALVCDRVAIISDGRLVAEGRTTDLARPRGVEVETGSGTRFFDDAGREQVPEIVARLVGEGEAVYRVEVLRSSLEEVYLAAVEGRTG